MESISDSRASCIGEINLSVNEDCSIQIYPHMMTLNHIPGIHDFIIEVMDEEGNTVDVNNLYGYTENTRLAVKLINPCTNQVTCWGYVNLEYKLTPEYDYYQDELWHG